MIRNIKTRRYVKLVEKIVDLSRKGYTLREIDEMLGAPVNSRRWLAGPRTRRFAKMIGY